MGAFNTRIEYFEGLASENKLIGNGQPVSEGSEELRISFISIEDEEGLAAAVANSIHFPCVVMLDLSGRFLDKESSIRREWNNVLWFLHNGTGETESEQKKSSYDTAETAMNEFISKMFDQMQEDGTCGPFKFLDMNRFSFQMTGRISDNLFGWKLSFSDENSASDITNFDSSKWVNI